jgi:hypothetical protein
MHKSISSEISKGEKLLAMATCSQAHQNHHVPLFVMLYPEAGVLELMYSRVDLHSLCEGAKVRMIAGDALPVVLRWYPSVRARVRRIALMRSKQFWQNPARQKAIYTRILAK